MSGTDGGTAGSGSGGAERPVDALVRMSNLVTPMALRVAATLRLVDHLRAGVTSPEALAGATGADADALARLMRHLAAAGVLEESGPGRYLPTRIGDLLADDDPSRQRSWLDLDQAVGRADLTFLDLREAVRTGSPQYEARYGAPFWSDLSADDELGASFDTLMTTREDAAFAAPVAAYDWSRARHVLDVGGAPGGLLSAILRAAPETRGTLLDLPGAAARARERIVAAGMDGRIDIVSGDFFDELPVSADVVVLSFVLLNWSDTDALRILGRCRAALRPGGRIVLLERAEAPPGGTRTSDLYFSVLDMRMLVFLGGRVRTDREWADLADAAGLDIVSKTGPLVSPNVPLDSCLWELAPR
ncbi:methyltransferase [Streptomyces sp. BB1-1-1]|uniref:methyltransferase n=1 Tax=Streptomyces sp. BB1-1-1 TaxID=3074430 RepID=UPI0028780BE0|nr:methyltransferase [Streptomyces sp. BB1-1-1]WND35038.1 methyltransferase [Streptomyces sp. BB1-1-1]